MLVLQGPAQELLVPDQPLEEFLISTDRDLYLAGETLWFASHCTATAGEALEPLSKVIYVELFSADRKVAARGKFSFDHGCSSGQLVIPPEQPTGVYFLRAYTQYLKNFHPATWPMKTVTVVNPSVPLKRQAGGEEGIGLQIAGGRLIAGIRAEVALLASETYRRSVENISLMAGDSVVIPVITLFQNGLAHFLFTPVAGSSYRLRLATDNGDTLYTSLPGVQESGICLVLEDGPGNIVCRITGEGRSPLAGHRGYHLTVSNSRFAAVFRDSVAAGSPVRTFTVGKDMLSPGMNYFLLTDQDDRLVDLRVMFRPPGPQNKIRIEGGKPAYGPRVPVELELVTMDGPAGGLARVSVAVVKKGTGGYFVETIPQHFIELPILLTPVNLQGMDYSQDILTQLKALMVLYGNQLSGQEDILSELSGDRKELAHLPEMRGITISGSVRNAHHGEEVSGSRVFLSYVGGPSQIHVNESQADGSFIFPIMPYRQQQDLFLCTFDTTGNQKILINNDFSSDFPMLAEPTPAIDTNDREMLEQMYINQQVTQRTKPGVEDASLYPGPRELGFGTPDISTRLEDYIDLPNMEVVLNEIVPFVKVRKRKGSYRITILDSETGLSYENHLVMIDNIPLYDINELMAIHPSNVEQVDVINRTYVIGDHTFRGIILVKTKTNNFGGITMPPDAVFIRYPLITPERTFIPVEGQPSGNAIVSKPELRNVLFWAPDIKLNGRKKISFRTSDQISEYDVIVSGISAEGEVIHTRTSFRVGNGR